MRWSRARDGKSGWLARSWAGRGNALIKKADADELQISRNGRRRRKRAAGGLPHCPLNLARPRWALAALGLAPLAQPRTRPGFNFTWAGGNTVLRNYYGTGPVTVFTLHPFDDAHEGFYAARVSHRCPRPSHALHPLPTGMVTNLCQPLIPVGLWPPSTGSRIAG